MFTCRGIGADIEVSETGIEIRPRGLSGLVLRGVKGAKFIPFTALTAVQLKAPGVTNGYIQFTLGGGVEGKKGIFEATQDENSVFFSKQHAAEFEQLKNLIQRRGSSSAPPPSPSAPVGSLADQLANLANLMEAGHLTAEEFAAAKTRLLGTPDISSRPVKPEEIADDEVDSADAEYFRRVEASIREIKQTTSDAPPARVFGRRR